MYHQATGYQGNPTGLPCRCDGPEDPSTMRDGLPNSNEVVLGPNFVQIPNQLRELEHFVIGEFRRLAQDKMTKSPLHCVVYNRLAQNRFYNPILGGYVEMIIYLAHDLQRHGVHFQQAVPKAAQDVYLAALVSTWKQYEQPFNQLLDYETRNELASKANETAQLAQTAITLKTQVMGQMGQGGYNSQQGQYGMSYPQGGGMGHSPQQMPHMGGGGHYGAPMGPMAGQGAVHSPAALSQHNPNPPMPTGQPSGGGSMGRFDNTKPSPNSWSSETGMGHRQPTPAQGTQNMQNNTAPQMPNTALPAPATVDDVVIDPGYYRVNGYPLDTLRPFDAFFNPGGVEIRPAHLSGWKRTRNDSAPYALAYDNSTHVAFHVKWPDGVVSEKIVEWTREMDYLRHETNAQYRADARQADGKVVPNKSEIGEYSEPPKPVAEVKKAWDNALENDDATFKLSPVLLEGVYTGTSDADNEETARKAVIEELELGEHEALPPYEYLSSRFYPITITDREAVDRLKMLASSDSLSNLARGLVSTLNDGLITVRAMRLINARMTLAVNAVLVDHLSLENLTIDRFTDDIDDLFAHLTKNYGQEMVTVIHSQTENILRTWLRICEESEEGEEPEVYIEEAFANLQVNFSSEQLVSLNLKDEAVLVRASTHPKLNNLIADQFKRHHVDGEPSGVRLRIITIDGVYLEVISGWLAAGAVLIKRVQFD